MKKITDSSVQNITEYENVIREQRQRIISLRDENTALKCKLKRWRRKKTMSQERSSPLKNIKHKL